MKKPSTRKSSPAKPSLLQVITNALEDLKAQDIVTLDVARLSDMFDTLVIASGSSSRQVRALAQHAAENAKKQLGIAIRLEGEDAGEWVIADMGDTVLHVMQPDVRELYDLEKFWQMADTQIMAAREKPAATPKTTKTTARKSTPASTSNKEAEYVTQSDAAKARKAPGKPRTAPGATKKATKTAPAKAGVYAKTGTKKPAAPKLTAKKPTTKKPIEKKPAEKKTAATTKPIDKKPAAKKATAKKLVTTKPTAKKTAAAKPAARKPRSA